MGSAAARLILRSPLFSTTPFFRPVFRHLFNRPPPLSRSLSSTPTETSTRLAAYDFAARKIRVNAIAPGIILPSEQTQEEFEMRQSQTPLGQGLGPDDIVGAVRYLVNAKHVTGHILAVDAGERLMGYGNAPFTAEPG